MDCQGPTLPDSFSLPEARCGRARQRQFILLQHTVSPRLPGRPTSHLFYAVSSPPGLS